MCSSFSNYAERFCDLFDFMEKCQNNEGLALFSTAEMCCTVISHTPKEITFLQFPNSDHDVRSKPQIVDHYSSGNIYLGEREYFEQWDTRDFKCSIHLHEQDQCFIFQDGVCSLFCSQHCWRHIAKFLHCNLLQFLFCFFHFF